MCQCFLRFLKCIAVTINVIFFIVGVAFIAAGAYGQTKVDVKGILDKGYKDNVPPIEDFVPNADKNKETAKLTKEADDFVEQSMEKIAEMADYIFSVLIVIGVIKCLIALFGIIALTCCNKRNWFVIIYLVLMILLLIPIILLMVITAKESIIRGWLFKELDEEALKDKFVNRFFMAALQNTLKCCGVRGNVDYYCNGIYDYVCNPGCLTFKPIWDEMAKSDMKICTRVPKLVEFCERTATLPLHPKNLTMENCKTKMNIQKPIDGRKSSYCKNNKYQEYYKSSGDSTSSEAYERMKKALKGFDPAQKYGLNEDPRVFDDPFLDASVTKGKLGCGFKVWDDVKIAQFLNYGLLASIIIFLLIVLQMVVAVLSIIMNKKNEKKESNTSSDGKSSGNTRSSRNSSSHQQTKPLIPQQSKASSPQQPPIPQQSKASSPQQQK